MKLRDALVQQAPSLALQRAAADEIARLDALVESYRTRYVTATTYEAVKAEVADLKVELDVCREAIEVAFDVVSDWAPDDDGDNAVRRTTLRRLNEAVGKAAPRLLYERPEGQKLYGLRYRELADELARVKGAA